MPTNRSPEEEMPLLVLNYVISSFEDFAACSDVVANERGGGFFGIGAQRSKSNVQSDQWLFCTTCQNMTLTESDGWINNLMLERITLNWYVRHQQKV